MADKTSKTIETLIRARYPLIYVVSFEEERVCNAISKIAAQRSYCLISRFGNLSNSVSNCFGTLSQDFAST